jgi:hypothetical protein
MSNKKTYKKSFEGVTMPEYLEKEILEMTNKPKKILWKSAIAMATAAAVVCFMVFGGNFSTPTGTSSNSFVMTALAAEVQEDGSVVLGSEFELTGNVLSSATIGGVTPGEGMELGANGILGADDEVLGVTFYTGFGIKLDGDNIAKATITTDQGYFSVLDKTDWSTNRFNRRVEFESNDLSSMLIWEFDYYGEGAASQQSVDRITWATNILPEVVNFTIMVIFEDGEIQEKDLTFHPHSFWEAVRERHDAVDRTSPPEPNPDETFG